LTHRGDIARLLQIEHIRTLCHSRRRRSMRQDRRFLRQGMSQGAEDVYTQPF
jgi:hypothetical protein